MKLIELCRYTARQSLSDEGKYYDFKTAQGGFKQYNADGSIFIGEFWLAKPGKVRFNYSFPNKNFIVSNGSFVFFWDDKLEQQTNFPLSYTPASLILDENISLREGINVKSTKQNERGLLLRLTSEENEDWGEITLLLDEKDKLKQWSVTDAEGNMTIMQLNQVIFDQDIEKGKFRFKNPRRNPFKLN
jgi:outer membrane lipoprotein-sorting protein